MKERVTKRKQRNEKVSEKNVKEGKEHPDDKLALLPVEASAVGILLLILLASFYVVSSFSTSIGQSQMANFRCMFTMSMLFLRSSLQLAESEVDIKISKDHTNLPKLVAGSLCMGCGRGLLSPFDCADIPY